MYVHVHMYMYAQDVYMYSSNAIQGSSAFLKLADCSFPVLNSQLDQKHKMLLSGLSESENHLLYSTFAAD